MTNKPLLSTTGRPVTKGVYFLSNDRMYEFTIAFLNSFRTYNPTLPLCFIPYDNECVRTEALKDLYRFEIFPDRQLLLECDKVSLQLHEKVMGGYRKLAAWEGVFDEFIYIDIDTVVLEDVRFAFAFLSDYGFLAATSNLPHAVKYVWLDHIEECGCLSVEQIAYSANMGFFVSKKGFMDMEYIRQSTEKAKSISDHMDLVCLEQPLLNYLVVTSGKPYSSLSVLAGSDKEGKIMLEYWGGEKEGRIRGGKMISRTGKTVLFIHWAGVWRLKERMPNKKIWDHYRYMKPPAPDASNEELQSKRTGLLAFFFPGARRRKNG